MRFWHVFRLFFRIFSYSFPQLLLGCILQSFDDSDVSRIDFKCLFVVEDGVLAVFPLCVAFCDATVGVEALPRGDLKGIGLGFDEFQERCVDSKGEFRISAPLWQVR